MAQDTLTCCYCGITPARDADYEPLCGQCLEIVHRADPVEATLRRIARVIRLGQVQPLPGGVDGLPDDVIADEARRLSEWRWSRALKRLFGVAPGSVPLDRRILQPAFEHQYAGVRDLAIQALAALKPA